MDYQFETLSPRSFEHLIQAIALREFNIGGVVFGDGRDNGREATFSGLTSYDTGAGAWDGYCVLQAKFRQKTAGTTDDGKWLLSQVSAELADFEKEGSTRKRPEYYVVISNVTLGGPHGGLKDQVLELLANSKLGFTGYDVWDYDKLRALLDGHPDIARTYAAWITSGDVLAAVVERLDLLSPDFDLTLSRFLQAELISDTYARLEQAGSNSDDKVPMAQVFVDLPVVDMGAPTMKADRFLTTC